MLPPILEIYVVWHPGDTAGGAVAEALLQHFRGNAYSGLIGGAIEVYVRSKSISGSLADAPASIPALDRRRSEIKRASSASVKSGAQASMVCRIASIRPAFSSVKYIRLIPQKRAEAGE